MGSWILGLAFGGFVPFFYQEGLPAAPFDLEVGRQVVELRKPLIARTRGVRLVLYVRPLQALSGRSGDIDSQFKSVVPEGSVTAYLAAADGRQVTLVHTGYEFYQGYAGLVLTEGGMVQRGDSYRHLELEARVPLKSIHMVWFDRIGRNIRDVEPVL